MTSFNLNLITTYSLSAFFALVLAGSLINSNLFVYPTLTSYYLFTLSVGIITILTAWLYIKKSWRFTFTLPIKLVALWLVYLLLHGLVVKQLTHVHNYYTASLILLLTAAIAFRHPNFSLSSLYHFISSFAVLEASVCIAQYFSFIESRSQFFQVTGTYENPNVTAMFMAITLPVFLTLLNTGNAVKRKFIYGALILVFIALILLKCRTAIIGSVIGALVFATLKYSLVKRLKDRKNRQGVILLAVTGLLASLYIAKSLYQVKRDSADGRIFIWKTSLNMILQNPLSGVGYGLFEKEYNLYQSRYIQTGQASPAELRNAGHVKMAYNEFIQQGTEGGLPGLCLFLLVVAFVLKVPLPDKVEKNIPAKSIYGYLPTTYLVTDQITAAYSGVVVFVCMSAVNFTIQAIPVWCIFLLYTAVLNRYLPAGNKIYSETFKMKGHKGLTGGLLILAGAGICYFQFREASAQRINKIAGDPLQQKSTNQKLSLLSGLEQELSRSESYWRNYANTLYMNKNYRAALDKLKEAQKFTSSPNTYLLSGMCYTRLKQHHHAVSSFQQAVFLEPSRFKPRYYLMNSAIKAGDTEKAVIVARQLIALKPKIPSREVNRYKRSARQFLQRQRLSAYKN